MSRERDVLAAQQTKLSEQTSLLASCYEQSWAVVIGVNAYRNVDKLEYARPDAEAVAATLVEIGFPAANTFSLLDEQATRQNIQDLLSVDLARKTGPNDRLFVFFAGHGQDFTSASGRKIGFFVPVDGDPAYLASRCISMTDVETWSDLIPAKHILFVMDCCYSGLAATRTSGLSYGHSNYLAEITKRQVRQIITAGRADEKVIEDSGQGVFTRALLRGLRGDADLAGRGFVTGFDLGHYLESRVYEESHWRQQPLFRYLNGDGEFLFLCGHLNSIDLMPSHAHKPVAKHVVADDNALSAVAARKRRHEIPFDAEKERVVSSSLLYRAFSGCLITCFVLFLIFACIMLVSALHHTTVQSAPARDKIVSAREALDAGDYHLFAEEFEAMDSISLQALKSRKGLESAYQASREGSVGQTLKTYEYLKTIYEKSKTATIWIVDDKVYHVDKNEGVIRVLISFTNPYAVGWNWSPEYTRFAFYVRMSPFSRKHEFYVVNSDGRYLKKIATSNGGDGIVRWESEDTLVIATERGEQRIRLTIENNPDS